MVASAWTSRGHSDSPSPCWFAIALLVAGCGAPTVAAPDLGAAAPRDAATAVVFDASGDFAPAPPFDIAGTYAIDLSLTMTADYGGGRSQTSDSPLFMLWSAVEAQEGPQHKLASLWAPCAVPIPGLGTIPYKTLEPFEVRSDNGTVTDAHDGESVMQPSASLIIGAWLSQPDTAPLPDGSVLCTGNVVSDCVVPDQRTNLPGAAIPTHGLSPDADTVYVVARIRFAVAALANSGGSIAGSVPSASLEVRVLGCHLRGAGSCAPADVAAIQTGLPKVTISAGTIAGHTQGFYFTCPQFLDDPAAALTGSESPPDGGVSGDGGLSGAGFSTAVQPDLDTMGCATRGCHDARSKMPLHFQPASAREIQDNYQSVLPWTKGDQPRFLNQVPLSPMMRARWASWIASGAPF
jgi:hypothetical protein